MKLAAPPRREGSILLVALVDVLFVLLLFFLLAAQAPSSPKIPLEWASGAADTSRVLILAAGGTLRLDGRNVTVQQAIAELQQTMQEDVELQPQAGLRSADLLATVASLRAAGIVPNVMVAAP